jgi:hypothetical protein
VAATALGALDRTGAFFGAGTSLLVACLCLLALWLRRRPRSWLGRRGFPAVSRLGVRNAADRPGRSVLAIGVIASATFILISVGAFRRDDPPATTGSPAWADIRCSSSCAAHACRTQRREAAGARPLLGSTT